MPRVIVCHDGKGWCKHRAALGIQKYAPPDYEVIVADLAEYAAMDRHDLEAADAVYHLYFFASRPRVGVKRLVGTCAAHGWQHPHDEDPTDWRKKGTTPTRNIDNARQILPQLDGLICRNTGLTAFAHAEACPSAVTIPVGVDLDIWPAKPWPEYPPKKLTVGWCAQTGGKTNFKGYKEIVVPLMEDTTEFLTWQINRKDITTKPLSQPEMVKWYHRCDVFLSTSSDDGTPNPPFEAMACGLPILTTRVGAIGECLAVKRLGLCIDTYRNKAQLNRVIGAFHRELDRLVGYSAAQTIGRYYPYAAMIGIGQTLRQHLDTHYHYRHIAPKILEYVVHGANPTGLPI